MTISSPELIGDCDADGDGQVDYKEFVDVLARGTVSNAAMGKRGMQSLEAMGVDSQEMLAEQLGHKKLAKFKPTINAGKAKPPSAMPDEESTKMARRQVSRAPSDAVRRKNAREEGVDA